MDNSMQRVIFQFVSNHGPILLSCGDFKIDPCPFRFFNISFQE